jgi:aminoglycoside 6'-N-acetyltransferase
MPITFRPLDMSDMPRLARWLMAPHVRQFYQPAPITLDEVTAEYAPMIGERTPTICHIAYAGEPFAYVQSYRNRAYPDWAALIEAHDGISLDLFIGDQAFLHRGFGRALILAYLREVALAHFAGETRAYIAPACANTTALRCSQSAGFRPLRELIEDGVPTLLLAREMTAPLLVGPRWAGSTS